MQKKVLAYGRPDHCGMTSLDGKTCAKLVRTFIDDLMTPVGVAQVFFFMVIDVSTKLKNSKKISLCTKKHQPRENVRIKAEKNSELDTNARHMLLAPT